MKKSRFTEEQIIGFLKQADAGMPVKELCRKGGFSDATFYKWRARFGGRAVPSAGRDWVVLASACRSFSIETGLHRGEIERMRWEHTDLSRRVLVVPETEVGEARRIPLSTRAVDLLTGVQRGGDVQVFPIKGGSISQAFERACRRAGMPDLGFHDLRHEATSRFFELGLSVMEVSSITGHKTLQMLKRYTHLRAEDLAHRLG